MKSVQYRCDVGPCPNTGNALQHGEMYRIKIVITPKLPSKRGLPPLTMHLCSEHYDMALDRIAKLYEREMK